MARKFLWVFPAALIFLFPSALVFSEDENQELAVEQSIDGALEGLESAMAQASQDRIYLKNGQVLEGRILSKDERGVWFESEPGTEVLFSHAEILKITEKGGDL